MKYFTHRFDGVLKESPTGGYRHVQVIPTPPVGTICELTGGGLSMSPCTSPRSFENDRGYNNMKGRLHGLKIMDGGEFPYLGQQNEEHWFEDSDEVLPSNWHREIPS